MNERRRGGGIEAGLDSALLVMAGVPQGKRVVLKKEDGGKELKTLKSLEEDEIDLEFEKWADDLSVRYV